MLAYLPKLYMENFNPHWPMFDPESFNFANISPLAGVAICCVGAIYSRQAAAKRLAAAVMLVQRPALISKLVCIMSDLIPWSMSSKFCRQLVGRVQKIR